MQKRYIAIALSAWLGSAAAAEPADTADSLEATTEVTAPADATPVAETSADHTPALASGSRHGLGLRFGTGGLGVDYTFGLNRWIDLRAGYNFGSYSFDSTEEDIEYRAKLKINAAHAMVDIKPFAGGFRISAGLYTRMPELTLKASGEDDYEINDVTYRGDLNLDGRVDLGKVAPYAGIGWGGTSNGKGFGVSFDMGVMFGKSPTVRLDATGRACDASFGACDPNGPEGFDVTGSNAAALQFQADKDAEVAKLQDDVKDFRFWPVIALGLHYRF